MLWITVVLFIVGETVADNIYVGNCPAVKPVKNLNVHRLMGKWYEAERYSTKSKLSVKCMTTNYALAKNDSILIKNSEISVKTDKTSIVQGIAKPTGKSGDGTFEVTYPSLPKVREASYYILGTNYDDWAVVWSCRGDELLSEQHGWILTRIPKLSDAIRKKTKGVFKKNQILTGYLRKTDQKNCPESY